MSLEALKAELLAGHPVTGAYSGDDATAAVEINALNRTRIKTSMSGDELFINTDATDFAGLTDAKKIEWLSFTSKDVDPSHANNVAFVQYVFGGGSDTVTNLNAARQESISRATELNLGTVRAGTVAAARALP